MSCRVHGKDYVNGCYWCESYERQVALTRLNFDKKRKESSVEDKIKQLEE